jgi:hypothetical protein
MIRGLVISREASAPIGGYLIAAFTDAANSSKVGPATAATQPLVGTTNSLGVKTAGDVVDIERSALPKVRLGGPVAAGDPLTANAASKAIEATVTGQRIIGFAEEPGVADDVIDYFAAPGIYAGA